MALTDRAFFLFSPFRSVLMAGPFFTLLLFFRPTRDVLSFFLPFVVHAFFSFFSLCVSRLFPSQALSPFLDAGTPGLGFCVRHFLSPPFPSGNALVFSESLGFCLHSPARNSYLSVKLFAGFFFSFSKTHPQDLRLFFPSAAPHPPPWPPKTVGWRCSWRGPVVFRSPR